MSTFELKSSRYYRIFLILILLGSVSITVLLPIHMLLRALCLMVLLIYGMSLLREIDVIKRLKHLKYDTWQIETAQSRDEGTLRGDSTVTPFLSILRFNIQDRFFPLTCVVFNDALDDHSYRQLLVILRTH